MKLYTLAFLVAAFCFSFATHATLHLITVQDFSFNPASLTVFTGDTVKWVWSNGTHTTTSTNVPAGANTWNQDLNSGSQTYTYVVMVPGDYGYKCSFHPTMMIGTITANSHSAGVVSPTSPQLDLEATVENRMLNVVYNVPVAAESRISLLDITGREVKHANVHANAGAVEQSISVADLPKGIYMLHVEAGALRQTRKVSIE